MGTTRATYLSPRFFKGKQYDLSNRAGKRHQIYIVGVMTTLVRAD